MLAPGLNSGQLSNKCPYSLSYIAGPEFFFFNFYFGLQANVNTYWGFKLNPYFHEEIDTRWLHLFNREKLGFFCILNKLTEQNNIARAMAQSVRCLLCKHEHLGLVPRTPVISQVW